MPFTSRNAWWHLGWVNDRTEGQAIGYFDPLLTETKRAVLDDVTLDYAFGGTGAQTVVFLNGADTPLLCWNSVLPDIARDAHVLAYNRPNTGRSSKTAAAVSAALAAQQLRALLTQLRLPPPYILVAHSLGGLYAQYFARHFPAETGGVVFVDATHPDHEALMRSHQTPLTRAFLAISRLKDRLWPSRRVYEADGVTALVAAIAAAPAFPPVRLTVISAGKAPPRWLLPAAGYATHCRLQAALTQLAPDSRHIIAERSGHFVQLNQPDIVITAIRTQLQAMALPAKVAS
jgi:pimeloyl-ACP methyl ester carboxylesterase